MESLAALCMMLILYAPQERDTLLDRARRNGGRAKVSIDIQSPIPDLNIVTTEAALIVRGIVTRVRTRLSDDEQIVVTEYEITPVRFYKGSLVRLADAPGPSEPLVVQRAGGALTMDGLQLETHVNEFPESESLREGEEVFLFLSPDATKGNFQLTEGAFGAYRISSGQVAAMTKSAASRRREQAQSLAVFENQVLALIRK
ncbi:MAG: hypothetical protein DMF84_19820 [Acidobacteria bacterium]|nr:MAG: hypothetical protein DMF84_19820 [Acidobacteriota bacterium]